MSWISFFGLATNQTALNSRAFFSRAVGDDGLACKRSPKGLRGRAPSMFHWSFCDRTLAVLQLGGASFWSPPCCHMVLPLCAFCLLCLLLSCWLRSNLDQYDLIIANDKLSSNIPFWNSKEHDYALHLGDSIQPALYIPSVPRHRMREFTKYFQFLYFPEVRPRLVPLPFSMSHFSNLMFLQIYSTILWALMLVH